ncbi:MAG TPA: threo-3-hydroxy-L-aspartate ammonia-lyase [Lautropia sp.]|nr:threo-3-hydroxy-L-aspartate ammonia-lyase [Lautropia sp.]
MTPRDPSASASSPRAASPTYADVESAAARLEGVAHRTPVVTSATADRLLGASLFFKCENLQRIGAFKFRGAYNAISRLGVEQKRAGVVTFSSGNHAQAIALAGNLLSVPTTILMPTDAPVQKVEATRGYGGTIVTYDRYAQDREALGRQLAVEQGLTLIPPFDHADVIAGQGTAARELFLEVGELDILLVPVGGGGLVSGCALAASVLSPSCAVIAVEPEAGNDVQQSFRRGEIVRIDTPRTIADGAQTTAPGLVTFDIIRRLVNDVVTVNDDQLVATMKFFASRMKLLVEPTGCLAAAAALEQIVPMRGRRVGVIVSGGNVDLSRFCELVT